MEYTIVHNGAAVTVANYGTAYALIRKIPAESSFEVVVHVTTNTGNHVMQAFSYSPKGVVGSNDLMHHTCQKMANFLERKLQKG